MDAALPPTPAPTLPARTVAIGRGGADGFVTVDSRSQLHVIYGGKYRAGPAPAELGLEEAIAEVDVIATATSAYYPVVTAAHLRPGVHVSGVGAAPGPTEPPKRPAAP